MENGFYWIRYNNEGWTIGEYDSVTELWMIPGDEVCKEQGWIDEVGERIERGQKTDTGESNCTLCGVMPRLKVETGQEFTHKTKIMKFTESSDGTDVLNIIGHIDIDPKFTIEVNEA